MEKSAEYRHTHFALSGYLLRLSTEKSEIIFRGKFPKIQVVFYTKRVGRVPADKAASGLPFEGSGGKRMITLVTIQAVRQLRY
jgi:hypothetical protein